MRLVWVLSSNVFIHKNCIFICIHTRTQVSTQIPTRTHIRTQRYRGKQRIRPQMDGQHNQHRPHLRILIWILIRIRIASYFEFFLCALTLREGREEEEKERQSKGNLPGDCFNIPLRASTCNDDDDDAASGPGGRHQVRGTQYQLPTTAGVLLAPCLPISTRIYILVLPSFLPGSLHSWQLFAATYVTVYDFDVDLPTSTRQYCAAVATKWSPPSKFPL